MRKQAEPKPSFLQEHGGAILALLVVMLIVVAFIAMKIVRSDGAQCLANPLQTGVDNLAQKNQATVMCSCSAFGRQPISFSGEYVPKE